MIFWHLGATVAIVRYVFKDPAMDLRFLMFGALLPDLLDKPLAALLLADRFETARVYAHALVFPVAVLAVVMLVTRRGTARRKALLGIPIGALLHLFLDAQWAEPAGFWWPFLGWEFPPMEPHRLGPLLRDTITDPLILIAEVAGLAYLAWLYVRGLRNERGGAAHFLRTGHVPLPLPPP